MALSRNIRSVFKGRTSCLRLVTKYHTENAQTVGTPAEVNSSAYKVKHISMYLLCVCAYSETDIVLVTFMSAAYVLIQRHISCVTSEFC